MGFELTTRRRLNYDAERLGMYVMGVYCVAGAEAARFSEDTGFISRHWLELYDPDGTATAALVGEGLWVESTHRGDGGLGYRFVPQPDDNDPPWCRFVSSYARPTIPDRVRREVLERDGHQCQGYRFGRACGSTTDLTLDHIWPYSLGGGAEPYNLQALCRSCNASKGARY